MPPETDERVHRDAARFEPLGAAEIGKIDDESRRDQLAAGATHELDRRFRRAAGRDQIVDQKYALTRRDRIGVNFDGIDAVFELVFLPDGLVRQLAFLAHRHEALAELVRDRTAEDEP